MPTFNLNQATAMDRCFEPDATHLLQLEKLTDCTAILRILLNEQGLH